MWSSLFILREKIIQFYFVKCCNFLSSALQRRMDLQVGTNVSEEHTVSIFKAKMSTHCATSHKNYIGIFKSVAPSNVTRWKLFTTGRARAQSGFSQWRDFTFGPQFGWSHSNGSSAFNSHNWKSFKQKLFTFRYVGYSITLCVNFKDNELHLRKLKNFDFIFW
jgi:hypothetical protein